jgi:hypothetical protein
LPQKKIITEMTRHGVGQKKVKDPIADETSLILFKIEKLLH